MQFSIQIRKGGEFMERPAERGAWRVSSTSGRKWRVWLGFLSLVAGFALVSLASGNFQKFSLIRSAKVVDGLSSGTSSVSSSPGLKGVSSSARVAANSIIADLASGSSSAHGNDRPSAANLRDAKWTAAGS